MKKYILLLFVLVFLSPLNAKAFTAPNGNEYNVKYHYKQNYTYQQFVLEVDYYFNKNVGVYDGKWWIWDDTTNTRKRLTFMTAPVGIYTNLTTYVYYSNEGNSAGPEYCASFTSGTNGYTIDPYPEYPTTTGDFPTFNNVEDLEIYLKEPFIDFDNPLYNPMMIVPDVEITYRDDGDITQSPYMPLHIALKNARNDLYLECLMVNYMPSNVLCEYGNYKALYSHRFAQRNLVSKQDLTVSSDLGSDAIGTYANSAWILDVNSYPVQNVFFTNGIGSDQGGTAAYNNAVNQYNYARNLGCFYGNNTELYFRYFEVVDGQFIVSAWRTWSSKYSDTFGIQLPEYYKTYSPASGYDNKSDNTSDNFSNDNYNDIPNPNNNFGTSTGDQITYIYNNNVPNYPDYPTIADYNKDNLLVNAIGYMQNFQNAFTAFGSFLSSAFVFIPMEIWSIIAMGFALSIIVFFLRLL